MDMLKFLLMMETNHPDRTSPDFRFNYCMKSSCPSKCFQPLTFTYVGVPGKYMVATCAKP